MPKKNILFINGVADNQEVIISAITKNGNIHYGVSGSANVKSFIQGDEIASYTVTLDTDLKQQISTKPNIHAVFNQISDADSHKITLAKAENIYNTFGDKLPFFNSPANIMKTTRDNIYQLLQGIDKLHVPKTVRIQPKSPSDIYNVIEEEDFKFPVIFRQAGDHGGKSTLLIKDKTDSFNAFALDGRDYYLTQFVDYADEDGIYVKYRLIIIDGEVFIRHAIFGKKWMMHAGSQLEEKESNRYKRPIARRFLSKIKPVIQPIITEIHHRLGLDYFGIDCHIDDEMNLLIFEINTNMNILMLDKNNVFKKHTEKAKQALIKMLTRENNENQS